MNIKLIIQRKNGLPFNVRAMKEEVEKKPLRTPVGGNFFPRFCETFSIGGWWNWRRRVSVTLASGEIWTHPWSPPQEATTYYQEIGEYKVIVQITDEKRENELLRYT